MIKSMWNGIIATFVISFLGWLGVAQAMPHTVWFEVKSVEVLDTVDGATPIMVVDRVIHRHFTGTYTVDVEKKMPSGRFSVVCSARNSTNYRPDAELPDPLTLDWWSWPVKCQIGPGVYRVETSWRIEPELFPDKVVTVLSDEFTVAERPATD